MSFWYRLMCSVKQLEGKMPVLNIYLVMMVLLSLAVPAIAANSGNSDNSSIAGSWLSVGSDTTTRLTFYSTGTFAIETKKNKLPTFDRREGGYTVGEAACNISNSEGKVVESGNLWMAYGENRCCYHIYNLGKILVMDSVRNTAIYTPIFNDICRNRTLEKINSK